MVKRNKNQIYREQFKRKLPDVEKQKEFVSRLCRYTKLYYFIAQFFTLEKRLQDFIVFAEVMSNLLIKQGKTSELSQLMKNIDLSKGAVEYLGQKENPTGGETTRPTRKGTNAGGNVAPRTTIKQAIDEIKEKFQISDEDAIVITQICEEISNKSDIKQNILTHRDNAIYIRNSARPRVKMEISNCFITKKMWGKLQEPMYIEKGGIITLMGEVVINNVLTTPMH